MLLTKRSGIIMGTLATLLGLILNGIYEMFSSVGVDNVAVCIIVFTVVVRLLMYPLTLQSTRSQKVQKYLQPEFNKITKKYRGKKDQDSMMKQQKETRELQEKYGIKMTAGCLTSVIQLPIFFALYYVIQNVPAYVSKVRAPYEAIAIAIDSVEGSKEIDILTEFVKTFTKVKVAAPTEGNINSIIDVLSKCDSTSWATLQDSFAAYPDVANVISENVEQINHVNSFILGINTCEAPGFRWTWAIIIPILSMVFQFLSMLVMPDQQASDPQQEQTMQMTKNMMRVMPVMSFFVCVGVPAGVGIYWAVGAFISFLTNVFTNLYYDHCDMEKIVEKQMAKAAKDIEKKKKSGKKSFMEKLQEAAMGQTPEQEQKPTNMEKYTSTKLKSYSSATAKETVSLDKSDSSSSNDSGDSSKNVTYKAGSIASKANAVKRYNEKGGNK